MWVFYFLGFQRFSMRLIIFFFSSRRPHTRYWRDWSSDVRSSDLGTAQIAPASDLPQARLLTPVNDASEPIVEVWSGRHVARDRTMGDVRCRDNGEVLFATISVAAADGEDAFGQATYVAYRSLLQARQAAGYPHLLRIWNSIPHINADDGGLERYRRFNLG